MLMHSIMDPPVGTFAGSIVEPTDVPTEDILPPILPPTEDIPPASDNILVRFTVGITRPAQTIPLLHRRSVLLLTHLAELNCSESRRGAVPTPPVSAHDVAGGCCAAGFQSDLCPLWVIFVRPTRFRGSRHVRFAPKADNDRRDGYVHFV